MSGALGTAATIEARARPGKRSADLLAWVYALGMVVPAALFLRRYPLRGHTGRLSDLGILARYGAPEYVGYVIGVTTLFLSALLAFVHCQERPVERWRAPIWTGAVGAGSCFALLYPVSAIDLFIYAVRSRLWTAYGLNPIAVPPIARPADPWLPLAGEWRGTVSPYGPLWNLIAAPGTWVGGDRVWLVLAYYKLLALGSYLLIGWLAYRLGQERGHPESAVLWLWNPLVLWEGLGNGHNDLVMLVPVALAIWAWERGRLPLVLPLLAAAVAIKYVALLIVPIAAVALCRRAGSVSAALRLALWSAAGAAAVLSVALWPFYDLRAIGASVEAQNAIMLTSPASMIADAFRTRPDAAEIAQRVRRLLTGLFLMVAAIFWARTLRTPERWVRFAYEVLFAYLLLAAWTFRPWYLIWLVAFAAFLPAAGVAFRAFVWTAGAMAAYALYIWIWHWWRVDFYTIQNVSVPLMFAGPVVLTLLEIGRAIGGKLHAPGPETARG